eukprot:m.65747 g.65747  ORF g.65747 m.65747 type:complete len:629 (+) comp7585_c0_seq1:203-2089(+)
MAARGRSLRRTTSTVFARTSEAMHRAADGLGRWFGISGQPEEMELQKQRFNRSMRHAGRSRNDDEDEGRAQPLGRRGLPQPRRRSRDVDKFASKVEALSDSSDDEEEEMLKMYCANVKEEDLCYDFDRAMGHYRKVIDGDIQAERKERKKKWFGPKPARPDDRSRTHAKGKPRLRRNQTWVALQLQSLPTFTPWFIYLMTFLQFVVVIVLCGHAHTTGNFGEFRLGNLVEKCSLDGLTGELCPLMFNGSRDTTAELTTEANMWFGPTKSYMLSIGAKFPPCMRKDGQIKSRLARQRSEQCGITSLSGQPNICEGSETGYSCCVLPTNNAGMTSQEECAAQGGNWQLEVPSGNNKACDENAGLSIVLRPCCIGHESKCEMLTQQQCAFKSGIFHSDQRLCSEVPCLVETCKLRNEDTLEQDPLLLNDVANPNQWFRFVLPMFMHVGLIHFGLNMLIQWNAGQQIEHTAGFLRTFLIYWISGIGGNAVSGIFVPYQVDAGPSGAVYGLLGVLIVELFQSWQIVPRPWLELTKLTVVIGLALLAGTFPFIDNFAHLGGFAFGIVASIIFLPYITFGRWDHARKKFLLALAIPLLLCMGIVSFVLFYSVQNTEFCSWCQSVNCISWHSMIDC